MRRFNYIIEDVREPDIQNIWLSEENLKYWTGTGWKSMIPTTMSWSNITNKPTFSKVATSGSYNDLTNKPSIPPAYSLPDATTSTRGGVLMASSVTDLAGTEDAAAICSKVNSILASLRKAGVLQS